MTGAHPIADFDAAYDNSAAVSGALAYPGRWAAEAAGFREALGARGRAELGLRYGADERETYDLFLPEADAPAGLVVFIHGGYWKAFDRSHWSHLARGSLECGHAFAVPSYRLAPAARLSGIARGIGAFLERAAARVPGPIRLTGHSAGGHLAARMGAAGAPIPDDVRERIRAIVPISGIHDLRPIIRTRMNDILRIDAAEALAESPALLEPAVRCPVTAYVGADELPELRRQSHFLASAWHGLGARAEALEAEGRHHFDVVDELCDGSSRLVRILTGARSL